MSETPIKNITVFRNIFEVSEPHFVNETTIFKRIKDGNSKDLIEEIQNSTGEQRANLKKRLPSICFSGRFGKRDAEFLLEHSGLICLDIDEIKKQDLDEVKTKVTDDIHCMACFVSPSGLGLKVIVKITPDKHNHKSQFLALEQHFNEMLKDYTSTKENKRKLKDGFVKIDETQGEFLRVHLDKSGKDINRVCYESFDPDIFLNPDSEMFIEYLDEVVEEKEVEDVDKTIELLQIWIDKNEGYYEGNRNNYLSKFLYALCRYGVSESRAKEYLQEKFPGLQYKDLAAMAKSCYKKETFGSAQFTETQKKTRVVNIDVQEKREVTEFWTINDKGRVKIDTKQFLKFIETNGFGIYRPDGMTDKWQFVFVNNMIVDVVGVLDIKKHILNYVEKHAPEPVFDELQMKNRYFENTFLNALPVIDIQQIRDTKEASYVFFDEYYYEITKDKITSLGYIDLKGRHIWKSQICKHNIKNLMDREKYQKFDFPRFVWNAMGKDVAKYKSACASIGYGLHTYKKKRLAKLIYACEAGVDELDGLASGGTGKEIFIECIKMVRNVVPVDGKDFDKRDKFKFQNVGDDTQVVVLHDYEGDISELFNRITGDFEVERKGLNKTIMEFAEAPKMFISANQSPKGFTSSFARRLHMVEFTNHYNENHTPSDDFGDRDFFSDDWNQDDWDALYSFLFNCIGEYLKNSLPNIGLDMDVHKYKLLVKNTGREFAEYFKELNVPTWTDGVGMYELYKSETKDDLTKQSFYRRLRNACKIYGFIFEDKGRGADKKIRIIKEKKSDKRL